MQVSASQEFGNYGLKSGDSPGERLNYIAESESFNHEFLLPKSYDMPTIRDKVNGVSG